MPGMETIMAVPKDKRNNGDLVVNTTARGICAHLLHITANEKNFPSSQSHFIVKMRDLAIQVDLDCWSANNILVDNAENYHDRLRLQEQAARNCTIMLELINIAKQLFHIPTKRYVYLTTQYVQLRKMIRNWYKSDRERLKPQ